LILKNVMKEQGLLGMVSLPMRIAQLTGLTTLVQAQLVRRLLPARLRIMPEMMPPRWEKKLAGRKEIKSTRGKKPKGLKVTYFIGCAMNVILPGIARDTIRLLEAAGCAVQFPDEYFCCGAPHIHEGDLATTLELAQKNILLLNKDGSDFITSDCDSCTATIKGYEDIVPDPSLKESAVGISKRCLALTELLERLNITNLDYHDFGNTRVAWDDPCELQHAQGITDPPRTILKKLPGVHLIELPESDWCCGCAGSYVIKHPDMSNKVLERKINALREIDIDVVLTSNPGCYLQLNRGIKDAGLDIKVEHISSFLCRHLKNGAEAPS
jgi:glycolate oxidase iron-sulfur subunit